MKNPLSLRRFPTLLIICCLSLGASLQMARAQDVTFRSVIAAPRPAYALHLKLDYARLTYQGIADVHIPVTAGDSLRDVVFHLYANAEGVPQADAQHPNIIVESVTSESQRLKFSQQGTLLQVILPAPRSTFVNVQISWHGQVPKVATPASALADLMPSDLDDALEANSHKEAAYSDYGLYSFRDGILSLGTYWFPMLALRINGQWQKEIESGPGDLTVAAASDYQATIDVVDAPPSISIITTQAGQKSNTVTSAIDGARDFPVVIADDFNVQTRDIKLDDRIVRVSSWARAKDDAKSAQALDVAAHALQIYSQRFGDYPYSHFTVVQGPINGGAGGAEFSGLAMMAQALYADIAQELSGMLGALGQGAAASGTEGVLMKQQLNSLDSLFEASVAHETAHQWWAISVGSDARLDPWLDESLTNYCSMLYYKDRYGEERYAQAVETNLTQSYQMARFMGIADAKVGDSTDQFEDDLQYGAVIYGKGALFYQALNNLLGDEKFNGALQEYFSTYRGKMATDADLVQTFKNASPAQSQEIEALYQHWIWQLHGDADLGVFSLTGLLGGAK